MLMVVVKMCEPHVIIVVFCVILGLSSRQEENLCSID